MEAHSSSDGTLRPGIETTVLYVVSAFLPSPGAVAGAVASIRVMLPAVQKNCDLRKISLTVRISSQYGPSHDTFSAETDRIRTGDSPGSLDARPLHCPRGSRCAE